MRLRESSILLGCFALLCIEDTKTVIPKGRLMIKLHLLYCFERVELAMDLELGSDYLLLKIHKIEQPGSPLFSRLIFPPTAPKNYNSKTTFRLVYGRADGMPNSPQPVVVCDASFIVLA
jgi:hypothetical protein